MKALVVLALLAVGCAVDRPAYQERPGQARAEALVWHQVYGMEGPAPFVDWRDGPALDCGDGTGFLDQNGQCVFGEAYADRYEVAVSWVPQLSKTSLAHEWCHLRAWKLTGDSDPDHQGECFLGGLTIDASEALRGAGL